MDAICKNCNKSFTYKISQSSGKYCSNKCHGEYKVEQRFKNDTTWRHVMRLFLIKKRGNKCECCGIEEWNGQTLIMNVDHINGNRNDNRMENLQILCPNCHSQTETFAYKNVSVDGKRRMQESAINTNLKAKMGS